MEPKAILICRPAPLGNSTVVTVDLPTDTYVYKVLRYMQKMRDGIDTSKACDLHTMIRNTVPPQSEIKYLLAAHKPRTDVDDDEVRRFGDFILGFIRDVCDLQHNRGIGTRVAIASMRTQDVDPAGTKLPSADDGTTRPTVDADMPQADSGTDLSGGQLQAGTKPPSVEAGPLLEVTNTLGTRPSKRKRSPSKRKRSQTMRYKQWLEG